MLSEMRINQNLEECYQANKNQYISASLFTHCGTSNCTHCVLAVYFHCVFPTWVQCLLQLHSRPYGSYDMTTRFDTPVRLLRSSTLQTASLAMPVATHCDSSKTPETTVVLPTEHLDRWTVSKQVTDLTHGLKIRFPGNILYCLARFGSLG